jgi:two-component system, NtrC family, response regulator HydG
MNENQTVLLVDDEQPILYVTDLMIRSAGIADVVTLDDSRKVLPLLADRDISLVVLDLTMPFMSGKELMEAIGREYPDVTVIVMTGTNDLDTAVQCMKSGAFDYLVKPVEQERFLSSITRALEVRSLKNEVMSLKRHLLENRLEEAPEFSKIITGSKSIRSLFQYLEAISSSSQPMLITGETGVGKELFAKAVHDLNKRSGQFIAVNTAGLDETVFSDTLFGHVKGAYTGADGKREGLIAKAAGGTLFLDEIGDLKDALQVKLLRLLQDQVYYPLGSDVLMRSEARIVVATNQNLQERMAAGTFRKDLYYRLRYHHIHIPPLRERIEDIPLLVDHFMKEAAVALNKSKPVVPAELIALLNSHDFPGNVRELGAMVHDAVARHTRGVLSLTVFREQITQQKRASGKDLVSNHSDQGSLFDIQGRLPTLKEAEDYLVSESVRRAHGNQGIAATMLGLTRQALNKRLQRCKE